MLSLLSNMLSLLFETEVYRLKITLAAWRLGVGQSMRMLIRVIRVLEKVITFVGGK